jgi:hypothetical protein
MKPPFCSPLAPVRDWPLTLDRAIQEIKYYQKHSADLIFLKSAFRKVCIEIADDIVRDLQRHSPSSTHAHIGGGPIGWSGRFSQESLIALQMSAEKYLTDYFYMA